MPHHAVWVDVPHHPWHIHLWQRFAWNPQVYFCWRSKPAPSILNSNVVTVVAVAGGMYTSTEYLDQHSPFTHTEITLTAHCSLSYKHNGCRQLNEPPSGRPDPTHKQNAPCFVERELIFAAASRIHDLRRALHQLQRRSSSRRSPEWCRTFDGRRVLGLD